MFEPDYFAYLLDKAASDPALGIVGTAFREGDVSYDYRFVSLEHVSGPCQLFRRECFEDIGGYIPVRGGGVDHIAVLTARMKGWKTRSFTEKLYQHRQMGSAKHGPVGYKFAVGKLGLRLGQSSGLGGVSGALPNDQATLATRRHHDRHGLHVFCADTRQASDFQRVDALPSTRANGPAQAQIVRSTSLRHQRLIILR